MEKIVKFIMIIVAVVMAASAEAQSYTDTAMTEAEIRQHLVSNPNDTVYFGVNKMAFVKKGRVCVADVPVVGVTKDGKNRQVTFANGREIYLEQKTFAEVDTTTLVDYLADEAVVSNPEHRSITGNLRHCSAFSFLGGANYLNEKVNPQVTLRYTYETCHFLWDAEGTLSSYRYTSSAEATGTYHTMKVMVGFGWKAWQNAKQNSYFAVGIKAGYANQRTDATDATIFSQNYGFACGAYLRGSVALSNHLNLLFEGGVNAEPRVAHGQGAQDYDNLGAYAQIGLSYRLWR